MLLIWQWCYRNTMIERSCFVNTFGVASCSTCALTNDLSYVTEKQNFWKDYHLRQNESSMYVLNFSLLSTFTCRAVNPPRLLMHDGEWVIDDVIMEATWRLFFGEKKARKRCCFNCNIWPNWVTSHQSHYCLYYKLWHTRGCEETFNVNRRIA